jgi:predicted ArsR family transcriptional regulator
VDELDALGHPQLRRTLLYVRAQARPVTADEVAGALAVSRSSARWRLEELGKAGLLQVAFERRSGRSGPGAGRPAKTYAPPAETTAIEFPRRRYETLVSLLARALPPRTRGRQLAQVGDAYAGELAAAMRLRPATTMPAALERLCRSLGRLGFHAAVDAVTEERAVLVCATCPLRPLVVADPEAAAIDVGMWRGLVAAATTDEAGAAVTCSTHDCLDSDKSCRIVVGWASG